MNFRVKLLNSKLDFEWFSFCFYTIRRPRLILSIYRYPFLSIRWLWFTFCFDWPSKIDPGYV